MTATEVDELKRRFGLKAEGEQEVVGAFLWYTLPSILFVMSNASPLYHAYPDWDVSLNVYPYPDDLGEFPSAEAWGAEIERLKGA